ncbi:MAG TPA: TIR domain-containing protein [Blastocatellia bacterium]|nr:TIR domain-containing protein [Blastocatellia bacterium]
MSESPTYDVFISHSSKDKPVVRELAERLKADGLRVWFDEWVIQPGDMIGLKIEQGLEQSRTLILVMSANAFASEWVTLERHTVMFRDPTNQERRFIPLLLDNAEIKDMLKQYAHIDWRQKSDEQYAKLLAACFSPIVAIEPIVEQKRKLQQSKILKEHSSLVFGVAVTADGLRAVSGHNTVQVWDLEKGICTAMLKGHISLVWGVAVTADGLRAISGSQDKTVRVWDLEKGICIATLEGHTDDVYGVAVTADGLRAVSGSKDKTVRVWDLQKGICLATLEGHTYDVNGVGITADGKRAISGSSDDTVRVWDLEKGVCITTLEGHTDWVRGVAVAADGLRAVSGSKDKTVRVWDIQKGICLATLEGHTDDVKGVSLTVDGRRAISGSRDRTVRVWELPPYDEKAAKVAEATLYTNAKVLLVGDSGVGKSGLAYRLTEDRFEPTISTDAAWATQLSLPHNINTNDIEREIWLWDFAGQADYRLIHQLFMDETSLAVLVFNPQSENPFEGLGQWDRDLQRAARRPFKKLLVAGRCDRGGLMLSSNTIEQFRKERGFASYLETSAYTGDGCTDLRDAIINSIPWDDIPWTSSPRTFKVLKEEIVKLKDEGKALLRMSELKQQLEMRLPGESFTLEQLRAVVGLLAGPGVVWQLEFGDFVLLQPERINAYAAAVIRSVRSHSDEIGCIFEARVLAGELDYQKSENQKMERLPHDEEQIVLRAMHQILVDHSLCLRENTELGTLLVFPSYFKRERPDQPDHPSALVTYQFSGMLDEIYATLVVKLRHTAAFDTDERWLWRFAADFRTQAGKRVGFYMTKKVEGAAELTVYCEPDTAEDTKVTFIRYIHDHLKMKDPNVVRVRHYVCSNPKCGEPVESLRAVQKALESRRKTIPCQYCSKQILLQDLIEEKFASERIRREVRELEQKSQSNIETQSRELVLEAHAFAIAREAGQIYNQYKKSDQGIDAEIEFKNDQGEASRKRVYLQLRTGDSYIQTQNASGKEVFVIKDPIHAEHWQAQVYPVMLAIRASGGQILWMNVTDYLKQHGKNAKQIIFDGEPFTALNVVRLRDRLFR